jgi:hypothetical protein
MLSLKEMLNKLEQKGLAYTCIINDEPIASAGMKVIWDGVAEGWVFASHKVWQSPSSDCQSH